MTRREWKAEVMKQLILRDWTIRNLAESVGYSYSHITNALNGGLASRGLFSDISACLGIEPPTE